MHQGSRSPLKPSEALLHVTTQLSGQTQDDEPHGSTTSEHTAEKKRKRLRSNPCRARRRVTCRLCDVHFPNPQAKLLHMESAEHKANVERATARMLEECATGQSSIVPSTGDLIDLNPPDELMSQVHLPKCDSEEEHTEKPKVSLKEGDACLLPVTRAEEGMDNMIAEHERHEMQTYPKLNEYESYEEEEYAKLMEYFDSCLPLV
ncbi:hypothetical protein D918_02074 [Trichuris suis]|nr:hypothetical protein D918_02074 [Trichuris suis]